MEANAPQGDMSGHLGIQLGFLDPTLGDGVARESEEIVGVDWLAVWIGPPKVLVGPKVTSSITTLGASLQ